MDVSIVAAVGSFTISERVLKPKATILFVLAGVLCYDLTTKTNDSTNLRVYRGPALLAFTLMMCAYSLRTWRRNGVACDELLFLPGTHFEARSSSDNQDDTVLNAASSSYDDGAENENTDSINDNSRNNTTIDDSNNNNNNTPISRSSSMRLSSKQNASEGDAAGGLSLAENFNRESTKDEEGTSLIADDYSSPNSRSQKQQSTVENNELKSKSVKICNDNNNDDSDNDSAFQESWVGSDDDNDDDDDDYNGENNDSDEEKENDNFFDEESVGEDMEQCNNILCKTNITHSDRRRSRGLSADIEGASGTNQNEGNSNNSSGNRLQSEFRHFRENHPRIVRIGTFFFFRTTTSPTAGHEYAPSAPSVFGAALDLSMPILINFHVFIEAYNHIGSSGSETAAKILPLIFLTILIVRSFVPPSRRARFWSTLKFTAMAPFHHVRFRDALVGDVLTSLVRPVQDVLFSLSYYFTVVYGTLIQTYSLSEAKRTLEQSWFLHNVVLTSFALLPLWWKFLQTLRQSYDANKRWPYLGDAIKYLSAALVIFYGMTHPQNRKSFWWIFAFICATLYQIWWDTFMDWKLFTITPKTDSQPSSEVPWCSTISSLRPDSYILLTIQMYIIQPCRRICHAIPTLEQIQLRPRRLYKTTKFYYRIFFFNFCLRFTWMLCFIPPYKFKGGEVERFSSDVSSYVGVLLPIAEIIRRCLWCLIKVEMETIRLTDSDASAAYTRVENSSNGSTDEQELEMSEKFRTTSSFHQCLPTWLDTQQKQQLASSTPTNRTLSGLVSLCQCSESFKRKLFLLELSIWTIAFVGLGYLIAYL